MRVERRGSSLFLYRSKRIGGRTRKEYLGPVDEATADVLRRELEGKRAWLKAERAKTRKIRQRATDLLTAGTGFDQLIENLFRTVMRLLGHELHNRGEWRKKRGILPMATVRELLRPSKRVRGLIDEVSPDPEISKILKAGAAGDTSILPAARKLFEDNRLMARLGSMRWMAEDEIVALAAGTNVVVAEAVRTKLREQTENLLRAGDMKPSAAERLVAFRAAHNCLVVHALETMMAREPMGSLASAALDKALGRAEPGS